MCSSSVASQIPHSLPLHQYCVRLHVHTSSSGAIVRPLFHWMPISCRPICRIFCCSPRCPVTLSNSAAPPPDIAEFKYSAFKPVPIFISFFRTIYPQCLSLPESPVVVAAPFLHFIALLLSPCPSHLTVPKFASQSMALATRLLLFQRRQGHSIHLGLPRGSKYAYRWRVARPSLVPHHWSLPLGERVTYHTHVGRRQQVVVPPQLVALEPHDVANQPNCLINPRHRRRHRGTLASLLVPYLRRRLNCSPNIPTSPLVIFRHQVYKPPISTAPAR